MYCHAISGNYSMSDPTHQPGQAERRRHFLVDINTVFGLLGKRYFLIFYFGRHLHPRQRNQLVNQRTASNWLVVIFVLLVITGFVFGVMELVAWRLGNDSAAPDVPASFTLLKAPALPTT